nr:Uncharacterised protein [Streptococcus thermophilus]
MSLESLWSIKATSKLNFRRTIGNCNAISNTNARARNAAGVSVAGVITHSVLCSMCYSIALSGLWSESG